MPVSHILISFLCADIDATNISVQDRRIGFVFQSYALFKHMTCADNITFGPRMKGLDINMEERCVVYPASHAVLGSQGM